MGDNSFPETYSYIQNIKSPTELGGGMNVSDFDKNLLSMSDYIDLVMVGESRASKASRKIPGNKFFYKTDATCKNKKGEIVPRSIYVNNITAGDWLPGSGASGTLATSKRGLLFGILEDSMSGFDPRGFANSIFDGNDGPCSLIHLPVVNNNNEYSEGSGYVLDREIPDIHPCLFSCRKIAGCKLPVRCKNPLTKVECEEDEKVCESFSKVDYKEDDIFVKLFLASVGLMGIYLFMNIEQKNILKKK